LKFFDLAYRLGWAEIPLLSQISLTEFPPSGDQTQNELLRAGSSFSSNTSDMHFSLCADRRPAESFGSPEKPRANPAHLLIRRQIRRKSFVFRRNLDHSGALDI